MQVLVIGGTRFIGPRLVHRLAVAGHEIAAFHWGQTTDALPPPAPTAVLGASDQ